MSLLPQETKLALTAMLNNLMSPDNEVRSQAEVLLNEHWIAGGENQLSQLLVGLAEASLSDDNGTVCFLFYLLFILFFFTCSNKIPRFEPFLQSFSDVLPANNLKTQPTLPLEPLTLSLQRLIQN